MGLNLVFSLLLTTPSCLVGCPLLRIHSSHHKPVANAHTLPREPCAMNPFPSLRLQLSLSGISSLPSSQSVRAFCVQMIQNQTPRGKPVARGDGASQGKTSGGAASSSLDASQSWFISRAGVGLCLCVGLVYGHSGAQGETAYPPKTASMRDPDRLCHSIILEPRAAAGPGTSELKCLPEGGQEGALSPNIPVFRDSCQSWRLPSPRNVLELLRAGVGCQSEPWRSLAWEHA